MLRDVRFGLRILSRNPSFAWAALLVVALGIGATTAVFTVIRGILIQPLPYRDPARIVVFHADAPGYTHQPALTPEEFTALRERTDLFSEVATANLAEASLTGVENMERLTSATISDNFLQVLGVAPVLGRQVSAREDIGPKWTRGFDISYELWQRRWHGDPSLVGRHIEVNNLDMVVVGIMPRDFHTYLGTGASLPPRIDVWFPGAPDALPTSRGQPVVARLQPAVTLEAAQRAVDVFVDQFIAAHPSSYRTGRVKLSLTKLDDDVVREVRPALLALAAAVGFVMLVACANLTNLLLARSCARSRELAVRAAIGASRRQLIQQLAIESLVIACLGAAAGLLVAQWGIDGLMRLAPATLPRRENVGLDWVAAAFAMGASGGCSLIFGLLPAWHATRTDVADMLKQDPAARRRTGTTRGLLVASQLALSVVLLVGAGLMARAFTNMRHAPLGFDPSHLVTAWVDLPPMKFEKIEHRFAFYKAAEEAVRQIAGVEQVGVGLPIPLSAHPTILQRFTTAPGETERVVAAHVALSGFLETLRVPLRAGRSFTTADDQRADPPVLLDERLASTLWPGETAVGKRLWLLRTAQSGSWAEVVGVVAHVQDNDVRQSALPQIWVTFRTKPWDMNVTARTRRDPREFVPILTQTIEHLGAGRPVHETRVVEDYVAEASADTRFALFVLGAFSVLALVLTSIGVYGIVAYATALRTREIALRLALGADGRRIVALVVREGAGWTAAGLGVGLLGAAALTRYLQTLLFAVTPTDPPTFTVVLALLASTVIAATILPARRAVQIDPMVALRSE